MNASDITVSEGRPDDERLPKETAVYDLLDRLGISYARADHPVAGTMEDCLAIDEALGVKICKTLFLCNRQKTKFYLLAMPEDKDFRTKDLSAQINSARLSFADADAMLELLNVTPGSVSIMGLMNDKDKLVTLIIDRDLLGSEYFGCHPCINTSSLKIRTDDVMKKLLPCLGYEPVIVEL